MAIYRPIPGFKGRTFKLCVLTRWSFNFCFRSSPLRIASQELLRWNNEFKRGRPSLADDTRTSCLVTASITGAVRKLFKEEAQITVENMEDVLRICVFGRQVSSVRSTSKYSDCPSYSSVSPRRRTTFPPAP